MDGFDGLVHFRAAAGLDLGLGQRAVQVLVELLAVASLVGVLRVQQESAHDGTDFQHLVASLLGDEVDVVSLVLSRRDLFLHSHKE